MYPLLPRKHRKLQASISNVKFDMASNDEEVKGCIHFMCRGLHSTSVQFADL